MARTKQAAPLRREPSDLRQELARHDVKHANGNIPKNSPTKSNGKSKGADPTIIKEQAGFPQLIICVGGIYVSL